MFHGIYNYFQKPPLGGRPNTKPLGDHGTQNAHNRWFILLYHVWGTAWIEIHWNSFWLRVQKQMSSHYTWGPVTSLHAFGGVLGWPLEPFFWALTISWSRLLACVWSGPYCEMVSKSRLRQVTTCLIIFGAHMSFVFISKWRFLSRLTGHIGLPIVLAIEPRVVNILRVHSPLI